MLTCSHKNKVMPFMKAWGTDYNTQERFMISQYFTSVIKNKWWDKAVSITQWKGCPISKTNWIQNTWNNWVIVFSPVPKYLTQWEWTCFCYCLESTNTAHTGKTVIHFQSMPFFFFRHSSTALWLNSTLGISKVVFLLVFTWCAFLIS